MRSNAQPPDESLQDSFAAPSPEQERILAHVQSRGIIDKDAAAMAASPTPVKSTPKQQRRRSSPWLLQAEREVDAQVDLHSLTAPEAIAAVEETMERLRILKQRWLRIIHGGSPGRYGPIKSTLDRQLRGPWRARIARWHTELNNAGSTLVELRLALVLGFVLWAGPGAARPSEELPWMEVGRIEKVNDGDSFHFRRSSTGQKIKLRLLGVDSPEKQQAGGSAATAFAQKLLHQTVCVQALDTDRYGRLVGNLWADSLCPLGSPAEIAPARFNVALVRGGYAWWYARYAPKDSVLARAEAEARRERLGLWETPNPIPPWEFRAQRRKK